MVFDRLYSSTKYVRKPLWVESLSLKGSNESNRIWKRVKPSRVPQTARYSIRRYSINIRIKTAFNQSNWRNTIRHWIISKANIARWMSFPHAQCYLPQLIALIMIRRCHWMIISVVEGSTDHSNSTLLVESDQTIGTLNDVPGTPRTSTLMPATSTTRFV